VHIQQPHRLLKRKLLRSLMILYELVRKKI
jgi:hypothetical protein